MTGFLVTLLVIYLIARLVLYLRTRIPGSPFSAWVLATIVADAVFFVQWAKARARRGKGVDWDEELKKL